MMEFSTPSLPLNKVYTFHDPSPYWTKNWLRRSRQHVPRQCRPRRSRRRLRHETRPHPTSMPGSISPAKSASSASTLLPPLLSSSCGLRPQRPHQRPHHRFRHHRRPRNQNVLPLKFTWIEAPDSGGQVAALAGLTIMAGGTEANFQRALPIMQL